MQSPAYDYTEDGVTAYNLTYLREFAETIVKGIRKEYAPQHRQAVRLTDVRVGITDINRAHLIVVYQDHCGECKAYAAI